MSRRSRVTCAKSKCSVRAVVSLRNGEHCRNGRHRAPTHITRASNIHNATLATALHSQGDGKQIKTARGYSPCTPLFEPLLDEAGELLLDEGALFEFAAAA